MHTPDSHDGGLRADLPLIFASAGRRRTLRWLGGMAGGLVGTGVVGGVAGLGALQLVACGGGGDAVAGGSSGSTNTGSNSTGSTTTAGAGACSSVPEETAGPYPGDGSNGANALMLSGIVRSDIRTSVGSASATAAGVPLTLRLTLANSNSSSCAALAGYAIYLWHCDREGRYSLYSSGVTGENYLRGVQETGSDGSVTFHTIFPGCYDGRMPHMHFEVYRSLTTATSFSNKLRTSQIAFPLATCQEVYNNASGYGTSVTNLSRISFATDNVFSDGVSLQMASLSGSVAAGYAAELTVAVPV